MSVSPFVRPNFHQTFLSIIGEVSAQIYDDISSFLEKTRHLILQFSYNEKVSSMYFLSGKSYRVHILIPVFEGFNENSYKHVFKSLNSLCCKQFAKISLLNCSASVQHNA